MPYRYSPQDRARIGKYAAYFGVAAASRFYSRKFKSTVSETTVHSIKKDYLKSVAEKRRKTDDDDAELSSLETKKRGRHVLLGEDIDGKVQKYLRRIREGGGVVTGRIAIAAARGILYTKQN